MAKEVSKVSHTVRHVRLPALVFAVGRTHRTPGRLDAAAARQDGGFRSGFTSGAMLERMLEKFQHKHNVVVLMLVCWNLCWTVLQH
jgi:hypothetical protein